MPRTPEEKAASEVARKERAKEWYRQRREILIEKQKAYNREKREEANKAKGVVRQPYGYLKAMTEEERKEFNKERYRQYHKKQREKKGLPPQSRRPPAKTEEERLERRREYDRRYREKRKARRPPRVPLTEEERKERQRKSQREFQTRKREMAKGHVVFVSNPPDQCVTIPTL
jgi:hypothetical protein